MGSIIEINDTLQITKEQGFPKELNLDRHLESPYSAKDFDGKVFNFCNKEKIRFYQTPPVRVFLVENKDSKWIYWGLIYITALHHNYINQVTSGEFTIKYIYTPEEMRSAHKLIDRNQDTDYFNDI
jgi:hypothetical protein